MKISKTRKRSLIKHYHLLIRCELIHCPSEHDEDKLKALINKLITDINMKPLAPANAYYCKKPAINEGMTALAPIETSHISFHFWKRPARSILNNKESKCLLQMDVYTCGTLTINDQRKVLQTLKQFKPTHLNLTLINREHGMSIEKVLSWDMRDIGYVKFVEECL